MTAAGTNLDLAQIANDRCGSWAYVLNAPGSLRALVIDPADRVSGIVAAYLAGLRCQKATVILTHEHFDHMSGVNRLRESMETVLIASRACSEAIPDPTRNLSRYAIGEDLCCGPADVICDDEITHFDWEGFPVEVLLTPGHSPGSVCVAVDGRLFTGDSLLAATPTVVKLPGGSRSDLERSLALLYARFAGAPAYPGHGPAFTLERP